MTSSYAQELLAECITKALADHELEVVSCDADYEYGFLELDAVKRVVLDVIVKEQAIIKELA